MSFISAKVLYEDEFFVGACNKSVLINSQLVHGQPRQAWINANIYGYNQLTFKNPNVPGTLSGVWLVEGEHGMLIDGSLDDVQTALSACCGDTPVVVTPIYNGVFPAVVGPTPTTYTFTRTDDGDISAIQDFATAYLDYIIPGTIQRSSYTSGVSTYTFQALVDPPVQGGDAKTGEAARLFLSNAPAALTGGQTYGFSMLINGMSVGTALTGLASLAALSTALNASGTYNVYGTYSVVSGKIQLSTTVADGVAMTVVVEGS